MPDFGQGMTDRAQADAVLGDVAAIWHVPAICNVMGIEIASSAALETAMTVSLEDGLAKVLADGFLCFGRQGPCP
jgi:hypothetical protein